MDVLSALRPLLSFSPPKTLPVGVPWRDVAEVAINNGVAPIVAYNLQYKAPTLRAPEDVRDRLLGIYQGSLSDNVFKLVNLKRLLGEIEPEIPAILLEAAAYSDALYPHVAFRPVPDVRLMVRGEDVEKLVKAGKPMGWKLEGEAGGIHSLTDSRTRFLLYTRLFGTGTESAFDELYARGVQARAFGSLIRRPSIEDALVTHMALLAQSGFDAPLIDLVDLRELVLGSPNQGGTYDHKPDAALVLELAEHFGVSKTLYAAMTLLAWMFPEVAAAAAALTPDVGNANQALLDRLVVEPCKNLERTTVVIAAEEARKLLMRG